MKKTLIVQHEKEIIVCDYCFGEIIHSPAQEEKKHYHASTCWIEKGEK